jgi:hypothetical protein
MIYMDETSDAPVSLVMDSFDHTEEESDGAVHQVLEQN